MTIVSSVECKGIIECATNNPQSFENIIYEPRKAANNVVNSSQISMIDTLSGVSMSFWQSPNTIDIEGYNLAGLPSTGNSVKFPELSWTREVVANTPIYLISCDGYNWMFEGGFPNGQYFPSYDAQVMKGYPPTESNNWRFTVILTFQRNSWWILSTQEHTTNYVGAYWKYTENTSAAGPNSVDEDDLWILFDPIDPTTISPLKLGDKVCIKSAYYFDTEIPSSPTFLDSRGFLVFQSIANRCFNMPGAPPPSSFMIPSLIQRNEIRADGADNNLATGDNTQAPYCSDFDCQGPICNMQLTFQFVPILSNAPIPPPQPPIPPPQPPIPPIPPKPDFQNDEMRVIWIIFGILIGILFLFVSYSLVNLK